MAFHLETFSSSIASGANTFAQVTYVAADAILQKLNNGMQVSPMLSKLAWVAHLGANAVHCRAQAPSMLPTPYISLSPNNRGTAFESPPRTWDMFRSPVPLRLTEEFDIFCTQNAGAGQTQYVACQFSDGTIVTPPPVRTGPAINGNGSFFSVHGTAATTLTAGAWTNIAASAITWDQAFPSGSYALVGVRAFSATGLFFRLFPQSEPLWRPGGIAVQAYDQLDPPNQRYLPAFTNAAAGWGVWLTFFSNTPPGIELFATAADVAEEVWYDCIKISDITVQGSM